VDSQRGYYQLQQKPAPGKPAPNKRPPQLLNGKKASSEVVLNAVPSTPLLDSSASKTKAHLANSGAMAARRPPSRKNSGVSWLCTAAVGCTTACRAGAVGTVAHRTQANLYRGGREKWGPSIPLILKVVSISLEFMFSAQDLQIYMLWVNIILDMKFYYCKLVINVRERPPAQALVQITQMAIW
jgi:hypothetical protein